MKLFKNLLISGGPGTGKKRAAFDEIDSIISPGPNESFDEESIPINIWDDFYDDGFIPEGEKQETYIYVESDKFFHEQTEGYLQFLLNYLSSNPLLEGVKLWLHFFRSRDAYPALIGTEFEKTFFERWEIRVENIRHEQLDCLMTELEANPLTYQGKSLRIYSES